MDPDVALTELKEAVTELRYQAQGGVAAHTRLAAMAEDVAERFEGLDKWLSGGGFLPAAWGGPRL
jgi:hypothetical protein